MADKYKHITWSEKNYVISTLYHYETKSTKLMCKEFEFQ